MRLGAAVVVVAVLALRLWSVGRWSWMYDDWVYMERSRSLGFFAFLFQNYNGHVMPGEFLVVWIVTKLAPLSHGVAVVLTAVAAAAATAVWAIALREMCGERLRALVLLLLVSLTPLQVQATIWWAAALQMVSFQLALGGCLYFATRLARYDRPRDRLGLLLTLAAGLAMWEKALLLLVPIVCVLLYVRGAGRPGRLGGLGRDLLRLAAVAVGYLVFYVLVVSRPSSAPTPVEFTGRSAGAVLRSFGDLVGHLLAPALLGGPWGTLPTEAHVQSHPPGVVVVLSVLAVLAALAVAAVRCRAAWLPAAMVATFAGVSWGLVVFSTRLDLLGVTRVGYERYAVDTFLVTCVAVGLYLSPEARRDRPAVSARPAPWLATRRVLAAAVVVGLAGSVAVANLAAVRRIGVSPAREWVRHVTADVHRLGPVSVYDAPAPERVLFAPFWGEHAQLSRMLSPLGRQVHFDRPADPMYVVSGGGRLVPAVVGNAVRSRPGPVAQCGYALAPGDTLAVPMTGRLYPYRWGLQVHAFAGEPGSLVVSVGGHRVPLTIRRGLNAPQAVFVGPVEDVHIESRSGAGVICVTDLVVGSVSASPAG